MDLNDPTTVALLAADAFDRAGHEYALYGGLLTAVYGEPRETRDADLAVVDVPAQAARDAIAALGVQSMVAFEAVRFGGLVLSRLTLTGSASSTGLNTVDLVTPRSARYARVAVGRSVSVPLRMERVRLLALEDFIIFKVLSTRERDLEDARTAIRRSGDALDLDLLTAEIAALEIDLPDTDVRGRWISTQRST